MCEQIVINTLTAIIRSEPHTLIAGTTGSGKSNLLNLIINDLTALNEPLILIDPKRVELKRWTACPSIVTLQTEPDEITELLRKLTVLMDNRYKSMQGSVYQGSAIFVIIDELADLMLTADNSFKRYLQRLLQLGRAAKIHIIAATQCPNRKVIPAEIALNFTCRIALRCLSAIESRQIIAIKGAEMLPKYGKGIMLNGNGYQTIIIDKFD